MPILFQISIGVNSSSTGRIAEQIGQAVIDQGWDSYITYARNYIQPSTSKTIKIGNTFDAYCHGVNTRLFDNHCLSSTNATKKLIERIKQIKPDIIQLHNIHGYFINMKILFDFLKNIDLPVVWTLHDCWPLTGHCVHFDYIGCEKWINGCYKCPQKKEYPASKLFDRSRKNYDLKKQLFNNVRNMTIVPVSFWLEKIVEKSFLKKCPIKVIPNGVDINIFSPIENTDAMKKKYSIGSKFILLGVASNWEKRKGLDDFILLNNIIDHSIYQIFLVGINKHQQKKIPKGIIGIERTENTSELAALYSVADVHISCSVEETFGLTVVESMACGTPVIVYNHTAMPELVDNSTGFVVEKGDIENLYISIMKIRKNNKKYYSNNCRKKAVTLYNKQDRYKEYITLYNLLLGK